MEAKLVDDLANSVAIMIDGMNSDGTNAADDSFEGPDDTIQTAACRTPLQPNMVMITVNGMNLVGSDPEWLSSWLNRRGWVLKSTLYKQMLGEQQACAFIVHILGTPQDQ